MRLLVYHFQIGDMKGLFGLLMVNMQMLRAKLKVVDVSYGHGTGNFYM
jgi:carotenoid 9,10(9',10')-cleavage dioxygenase 1